MVLRAVLVGAVLFVATAFVHAQDVRDTVGPLEKSATQPSPENPIPRRLSAPPAVRVQEWQSVPTGYGLVRLQVTLDTSGRVAEVRSLAEPSIQFATAVSVDDRRRRALADAMLKSAAASVSRWTYETPQTPITFPVAVTFPSGTDPIAVQDSTSLAPRGGGTPVGGVGQPWPAVDGALRVGGRILPPTLTKKVTPVYPKAALAERIRGFVILEAVIGVDGKVTDTRVLRSVPLLDKAASDAVRQWEYTPTTLDGKPIRIVMTVTVTFNMETPPGEAPSQASGPLPVTPWPGAEGAVRVGGNIAPPKKTKDARAVYPVGAQADRLSGAVILEVLIGPDGKVKDVRVLRSSPVFDKSAVDAVRKWEYDPTLVNGVPVAVVMPVTVSFSLR